MNTAQITHALEEDPITKKTFCGVFPSDKLPQTIDKYPCGFVANTDPSSKPGTHWISIWIGPSNARGDHNKILGEYFDSYGTDVPLVFRNYLEKHTDKWKYNKRKLQSIWSDVCGDYCIFYLSHRARGYSMNKIVQLFDDNTMLNDAKVSHFVKTHFRVSANHPNVNLMQFSKKLVQ